jgi:hypothetical protein
VPPAAPPTTAILPTVGADTRHKHLPMPIGRASPWYLKPKGAVLLALACSSFGIAIALFLSSRSRETNSHDSLAHAGEPAQSNVETETTKHPNAQNTGQKAEIVPPSSHYFSTPEQVVETYLGQGGEGGQ